MYAGAPATCCVGCGCKDQSRLRYTLSRKLLNVDAKLPMCRGCWLRIHRCANMVSQPHQRCERRPSGACKRFLDELTARLPCDVILRTRNYDGAGGLQLWHAYTDLGSRCESDLDFLSLFDSDAETH